MQSGSMIDVLLQQDGTAAMFSIRIGLVRGMRTIGGVFCENYLPAAVNFGYFMQGRGAAEAACRARENGLRGFVKIGPALRGPTLLGVALAALLTTGTAGAISLNDALVQAYLGNPELAAGRSRLRATDELVPQALAGWRPRVFLDSTWEGVTGQSGLPGTGNTVDTDRSSPSIGLSVRQNLYDGGGTIASTSRAENLVRAERANLVALQQSVLLDAADAYSSVWRDRAVLDLAVNNERRLRRQLQATRDRFSVGEVARTDVAQAEARVSRARADIEAATAALAASAALYGRVVGEDPPRDLARPAPLTLLPRTQAEARAIAAANPSVIAASFNLSAAKDDVDIAFSDLLPSVDLEARLDYAEEPTAQLSWTRGATLGLTLSVPLYQGGAEYSRVRQNRQTVEQRRNLLENTHRSVQENVAAAWDRLAAAKAAISALRSEARANQVALEGVQEEALVGARTVLDVLDAEQELFASQVNLVRAQREEVLASYQLKQATGQLTVAGLGLAVQPYDPEAYYEQNRNRLFGLDTVRSQPTAK